MTLVDVSSLDFTYFSPHDEEDFVSFENEDDLLTGSLINRLVKFISKKDKLTDENSIIILSACTVAQSCLQCDNKSRYAISESIDRLKEQLKIEVVESYKDTKVYGLFKQLLETIQNGQQASNTTTSQSQSQTPPEVTRRLNTQGSTNAKSQPIAIPQRPTLNTNNSTSSNDSRTVTNKDGTSNTSASQCQTPTQDVRQQLTRQGSTSVISQPTAIPSKPTLTSNSSTSSNDSRSLSTSSNSASSISTTTTTTTTSTAAKAAPIKVLVQNTDEEFELAAACKKFISRFLQDYVFCNQSAQTNENPFNFVTGYILKVVDAGFLPLFLKHVPKLQSTELTSLDKRIVLSTLQRVQEFLDDYCKTAQAIEMQFPNEVEKREYLIFNRMNETRVLSKQATLEFDVSKLNDHILSRINKLVRILSPTTDTQNNDFVEAILGNLPMLLQQLLHYFFTPYFLSVVFYHELSKQKTEQEKKIAKDRTKIQNPIPEDSEFDKGLGTILTNLSKTLAELGGSSTILNKAITTLISSFKLKIIKAILKAIRSVSTKEKITNLVNTLFDFMWEIKAGKTVPALQQYFTKATEQDKTSMRKYVEEKLKKRIAEFIEKQLKPIMPTGTGGFIVKDGSVNILIQKLSLRLYQITQQQYIIKMLIISLLDAVIPVLEGERKLEESKR